MEATAVKSAIASLTMTDDTEESGTSIRSRQGSLSPSSSPQSAFFNPAPVVPPAQPKSLPDSLSVASAPSYWQALTHQIPEFALTMAPPGAFLAPQATPADMQSLITLYTKLNAFKDTRVLNDAQLLALEDCKLAIMQQALAQFPPPVTPSKDSVTAPRSWLQTGTIFLCLVLGTIYSFAESFTGTTDLFGGLFAIAEPITFTASIVFAILSNLLFFALEAKGFMVEAGISSPFSIMQTVKIASAKLAAAKALSRVLRNPTKEWLTFAKLENYEKNVALLTLIHNDISADLHTKQVSSAWTMRYVLPVLKYMFSFAGASLFACTGIIIGKDLIANIAALSFGVTLATPVALLVIGTLAVAGFTLFYALQHRSVFDLFDALAGRPKDLVDDQTAFCKEFTDIRQNIDTNIALCKLRQVISPVAPSRTFDQSSPARSPACESRYNRNAFFPTENSVNSLDETPQSAAGLKRSGSAPHLSPVFTACRRG